jgi:lysophospholipid acyltransferase (LPLAT)-like uncharacterized protein
MKARKFKKWQIIEIFWVDSMHTSRWTFEDEVEGLTKDKYLLHATVGYFFRQDKHQIVVVQSKSNDGEEKSNVAEIMCIPLVAVKHIKIK